MDNLKKPFHHFSVDDVFKSLIEIADEKIDVFEHPFFSFLKELHDEFGVNVDLYLFFQEVIDGRLRTLRDVSDSIKQTLNDNPWIRFGPHSLDQAATPYSETPEEQKAIFDQIYNEIYRFSGKKNMSKWVRLNYFSESYELKDYFNEHGVEALFTTDKDRITTRIPEPVNESLRQKGFAEYNGFKFIRTHIRTENLANEGVKAEELSGFVESHMSKLNHIIISTHEYEVVREEVRFITKELIKELYNRNILSC